MSNKHSDDTATVNTGAIFMPERSDGAMEYDVRVSEVRHTYITVNAGSMTEAKRVAQMKWEANDYEVDARHSKRVHYEALYPDYDRPLERSR